jgi:hypothetical protein
VLPCLVSECLGVVGEGLDPHLVSHKTALRTLNFMSDHSDLPMTTEVQLCWDGLDHGKGMI